MTFDSIINRGEYLSAFYVAEKLTADLKMQLLDTWTLRENDPHHKDSTPRRQLRGLRSTYLHRDNRPYFAERATADAENGTRECTYGDPRWIKQVQTWHGELLRALGYAEGPTQLTVHNAGRDHVIDVAWAGDGIVAVDCGWAASVDDALEPDGPGRLLVPVQVRAGESYETGPKLASWLFGSKLADGKAPRFVLLLCGGVIVLTDHRTWEEGRFLAADLDTALERNDQRQTGELATIAALFSHEMLIRGDKAAPIDELLTASTNNAAGVSGQLRAGLQHSVEIIANEVLARLDQAGVAPKEIEGRVPFARQLTRETLRYLYRILFLLYAEARPELRILPSDDSSYEAGYSVARLRELVARDEQIAEEDTRHGFHLFNSLEVLFDLVNNGHPPRGTEAADETPGDRGLRFEPLRSTLFEPDAITLIGRVPDPRSDNDATLDLRLRNEALHRVLRLLTMKKGSSTGERGGFVSYRNLGINQLGAVYEGLISYTGIIAEEEHCEVAKNGEPEKGSWLIPAYRQGDYPADTLVQYDEEDERRGLRGVKRYHRGEFVYRLAGRDRETSASYYTPESLTKVTVELALKHRLDQQRDDDGNAIKTRAAELLQWTICEPALGSGAFANEAINQVAEEYLRRRQDEKGESISAADLLTEKQKVKAYIALHNVYGVDLNATGVELAEVSLWLNTMHPGMQAPWFGLHLRRGNSLIGARRAVYAGADITSAAKQWISSRDPLLPTSLPLSEPLSDRAVHQFLLPNLGWAAIVGSTKARALVDTTPLKAWRRGLLTKPTRKQYERLRIAAHRVEFLWSLVVKRMEISEKAISRHIPIWGADAADEEFAFLHQPAQAVTKEQVLNDLFNAVDTPYWRLKTVMDAWCALWFWPVDQADLLDGSHARYTAPENGGAALQSLLEPKTEPGPVVTREQGTLFAVDGEQMTIGDVEAYVVETAAAKKNSRRHARPVRRPVIPLKNLDDWLDFLESMLGATDAPDDTLLSTLTSLDDLKAYEEALPGYMGMASGDPEQRFPWLGTVREIADEQGFLHWELEFARVFTAGGGFDLQIGNPPWVRPDWLEDSILAEFDPWFALTEKPRPSDKAQRRRDVLADPMVHECVLYELTITETMAEFLASPQTYPLIAGTRPDLYRAFMCQTWHHAAPVGCTGLLHPDTHFNGDKEGPLRVASYRRLRVHADFVNAGNRFFPPPFGRARHFGMHVYGEPREIDFIHLSWLFSVDALRLSENANTDSDPPAIRFKGKWDERPHPARIVRVTLKTLERWRRLTAADEVPLVQTKLLTPVSATEESAIAALVEFPTRVGQLGAQIARGFDESGAKMAKWGPDRDARLIDYNRNVDDHPDYFVPSWEDVVLKGLQIGVANPMFKQPSQGHAEVCGLNPAEMTVDAIPESEYRQVAHVDVYRSEQDHWVDHVELAERRASTEEVKSARIELAQTLTLPPEDVSDEEIDAMLAARSTKPYSTFYRLAWRRQIAPNSERTLYSALIPPGPTHVDLVHSLAMRDVGSTALTAGFWSSMPLDYLIRASGRSDLRKSGAAAMPTLHRGHPLARPLLVRTLRLNCLTNAYADLWAELFDPMWTREHWALDWDELPPLADVTPDWRYDTPLRSERARRSALVEIDALVAVCLGIDANALLAIYRSWFPITQDFDEATWFDANGRKIAGHRYTYGFDQTKEHWKQFLAYQESTDSAPPPDGYTPPFHKAVREKEMWEAHAIFQARLDAAIACGEWDQEALEALRR